MDAYDLVISVFALNPRYCNAVQQNGVSHAYFAEKLLSNPLHTVLKDAGIRVHRIHKDSSKLEDALACLLRNRVLVLSSNVYFWDHPITPSEYFNEHIKPRLKEEELSRLETFTRSL